MLESTSFQEDVLACTSKDYNRDDFIHEGQTIVYEGKKFEVARVRPLLVIKSRNRVVCGNLYKHIKPIPSHNH